MATIFGAVTKQSQRNQIEHRTSINQPTIQYLTTDCITNGLFPFDETINNYYDKTNFNHQTASTTELTAVPTTPSSSSSTCIGSQRQESQNRNHLNDLNMLDNIWLIPSKQKSNQPHLDSSSVDHIDILAAQSHFQLQNPHNRHQHQHQQTHPLFLTANMDAGNLQQSQPTDHLQQPSPNCSFGGDATYHFKTLVPAIAAGAIIGKGGETIASIQKDTGARVKMSKSHDFYPGTQERICLITGSIESILKVLEFIMEKIREKPDQTLKLSDVETKQAQERDKQVKILVPNSTAGMIIGKAGAYIKQIKEESGSYVQISQKPKELTLQERCITIIGDKDNNKVACKLILAKIMEDPSSGTCLNVSYADVSGPVANFNPTGSPYAANQTTISSSTASLNSAVSAPNLFNGNGINLSINLGPAFSSNQALAQQIIDSIKIHMRSLGYTDMALSEIVTALGTLSKYGSIGTPSVGITHTNGTHTTPISYLNVAPMEQPVTASSVYGAIGQLNMEPFMSATSPTPRASIDRFEPSSFEAFRHISGMNARTDPGQQAAAPISINTSYGLTTANSAIGAAAAQTLSGLSKSPTPADVGLRDSKTVEIPESIVGAILGPNGQSLIDIQQHSGATIQISKKGLFAPGTKNRIVTISGAPNSIHCAHYLIEKKVNEEETKRRSQNTITGIPGIMQ